MKKQFISLPYHFTLGQDSVLIRFSFSEEAETCQDVRNVIRRLHRHAVLAVLEFPEVLSRVTQLGVWHRSPRS